jgi:hypothetical protein
MYHDRTAWRCAFFAGKKYGYSKGYPQRNAAQRPPEDGLNKGLKHVGESFKCFNVNFSAF